MTLTNPLPDTLISRRPSISYRTLPESHREAWHLVDNLCNEPGVTARENVAFHAIVAALLGVRLRPGGQLVQCGCDSCPDDCDRIYDLDEGAEYLDEWDLQRPQCPSCVADHRQIDA